MQLNIGRSLPSVLLTLLFAAVLPADASECAASRPLVVQPSASAALVKSPGLAGFDTPRGERWSAAAVEAEIVAADPLAGPPSTLDVRLYRDWGRSPGTEVCKARNLAPEIKPLLGGWQARVTLPASCALCAGQRYWLSIQAFGPTTTYQWRAVDPASSSKPFVLHGQSQEMVAVKGDFNGDLCPDLVLQEQTVRSASTAVKVWWMNGAVRIGEAALPSLPQPWRVVAAGFGLEENTITSNTLTLQNPKSGDVRLWHLEDLAVVGEQVVVADPEHGEAYPKPDRRLLAADHFLPLGGGGRSPELGSPNGLCQGDDGSIPYPGGVVPEPSRLDPQSEQLRAAADVSGDGYPDFLLQSPTTGEVSVWHMELAALPNGDPQPTRAAGGFLAQQPPPGWRLSAVGDFGAGPGAGSAGPASRCGAQDLVFQDAATSGLFIWHLNHNLERTGATALGTPGSGWVLVAPR